MNTPLLFFVTTSLLNNFFLYNDICDRIVTDDEYSHSDCRFIIHFKINRQQRKRKQNNDEAANIVGFIDCFNWNDNECIK